MAASTGFFCSCTVVEKAARGTVDVKLEERASVREMVAIRRTVISVRKDILAVGFWYVVRGVLWLLVLLEEAADDDVEFVKE